MKLRIKGNSIRLRLLRSEVERLAAAGVISEEVRFGLGTHQALLYSVAASPSVEAVTVQYSDDQILVLLPESLALKWTSGNDVGIEASMDIGGDSTLAVLIEKDFECVDRPDDPDRADAFPNPLLHCKGDENGAAT